MGLYIVTGAAGFIGSHLIEALLAEEKTVLGIDEFNDYYDPKLKWNNLAGVLEHPQFKLVQANILDLNWTGLLADVEVVFHQAAQAGVRASWGQTFHRYTERNLNATQAILEGAKEAKQLKRLVYASSSSIYGDAERLPTSESTCPKPISPYGITKLAGEQLCWQYHRNFGVPATALRYFTVYGPRQRPDMAFHKFLKMALADEAIPIYGDGQQTRDFTFVGDAVAANLAAAVVPQAVGEAFNIGGGSRVALTGILAVMEETIGTPLRRSYLSKACGDARHTAADITKACSILGYDPQMNLEEGLSRQWKWIREFYTD